MSDGYVKIEKTIAPKWAVGNNEVEDFVIPITILLSTYVLNEMINLPLGFIGLFLYTAYKSFKVTRFLKKGKSRSIKQHYKYKFGMVKTTMIPQSFVKEFNGA